MCFFLILFFLNFIFKEENIYIKILLKLVRISLDWIELLMLRSCRMEGLWSLCLNYNGIHFLPNFSSLWRKFFFICSNLNKSKYYLNFILLSFIKLYCPGPGFLASLSKFGLFYINWIALPTLCRITYFLGLYSPGPGF